jgi:hypothetical protein
MDDPMECIWQSPGLHRNIKYGQLLTQTLCSAVVFDSADVIRLVLKGTSSAVERDVGIHEISRCESAHEKRQ